MCFSPPSRFRTFRQFNLLDECQNKYGSANAWRYCCAVFDLMPVAAVIEGTVLCVHGGLSPDLPTIDQIALLDRCQEIPSSGAFCDLVWSDPEDAVDGWVVGPRGAGYLFGARVVAEFNRHNGTELIARAHQLVQEGLKYMFDEGLTTVWSAPNYCYRSGRVDVFFFFGFCVTEPSPVWRCLLLSRCRCGNLAAVLQFNADMSREILKFNGARCVSCCLMTSCHCRLTWCVSMRSCPRRAAGGAAPHHGAVLPLSGGRSAPSWLFSFLFLFNFFWVFIG
jgi:diadenosine tetraphosphatase ApaH/serine/threonine PP2A family protein phosphatase